MYAAYWGLTELPFENTPNPRFLYQSPQHQEALARLTYVVEGRKGAGVLTGVFGCGKTLIARALLAQLAESRYRAVYLSNPLMSGMELLHAIAARLHVPQLAATRSEVLMDSLIDSIEHALRENLRDGKETVIIVDEAHLIEDVAVMEQLRLLLNFQDEDLFLLTLILMGQPELKELIDRHKPLAQRICMGYHLEALSVHETAEYVGFRLSVAGANREIFTPAALHLLHQLCGGIPRRINQLGDLSLVSGMAKQAQQIDELIIRDASASLGI